MATIVKLDSYDKDEVHSEEDDKKDVNDSYSLTILCSALICNGSRFS